MNLLPKEPPLGLLISMALRLDHALGCKGYYDQPIFNGSTSHKDRFQNAVNDMRKLYEEVAGYGFYSTDKDEYYKSLIK